MEKKEVTVITGPMRSGTSCVTGLLERLGFDLGRNVRVLRDRTEHNPMGHFEPDLLHAVNLRLVEEVPGGDWSMLNVPPAEAMDGLAGTRGRYFETFIKKFDGEICKDPLLCLTLSSWERHWPALGGAVFCLRHPLAVARSIEKRYGLSQEEGLGLWRTYTVRFFEGGIRRRTYVFDFDAFRAAPEDTMAPLLVWLKRPAPGDVIRNGMEGFYSAEFVHWKGAEKEPGGLPADIAALYDEIRSLAEESRAGALRDSR